MNILIFEPNQYHYEVLPGFAKYFDDLGHKVSVLSHEHSDLGNEFCLYEGEINISHFKDDCIEALKYYLQRNEVDVIFVSSFDHLIKGQFVDVAKKIFVFSDKKWVFGCYHDLENIILNENEKMLDDSQIVTLSDFIFLNKKVPMVNPHYFGKIENRDKNDICKIISIGISNARKDVECALDDLHESDEIELMFVGRFDPKSIKKSRLKRKLFYPICKLFFIKPYNSKKYKPIKSITEKKIKDLGKLKFEAMYQYIRSSDFILINIDLEQLGSFVSSRTTGSKQLALGFNKPCIIPSEIAQVYGFNDTNSIIYVNGKLDRALKKAVDMSNVEYKNMCRNLEKMRMDIYSRSKEEIKRSIEHGCNRGLSC